MGEHELVMRYGSDTASVFLELMEQEPSDDPVQIQILLDRAILSTKAGGKHREPVLKGYGVRQHPRVVDGGAGPPYPHRD